MLNSLHRVRTCVCFMLIMVVSTVAPLNADTIIEMNDFSFSQPFPPTAPGGQAAETMPFSLSSADIDNITFEANFDSIDAGIAILVNGLSLFNTGPDVSEFNEANPMVFTDTGVTNLGSPFGPRSDMQPRLTVASDSTGTTFSGPDLFAPDDLNNPASIINYTPSFSVASFRDLLQVGSNQIEIQNLNTFEGAGLTGDYTLTLVTPATSVPEPTGFSLCLFGATCCMVRRRRR